MNETDYNARLYEKMKTEQDKYHLPFFILYCHGSFCVLPPYLQTIPP